MAMTEGAMCIVFCSLLCRSALYTSFWIVSAQNFPVKLGVCTGFVLADSFLSPFDLAGCMYCIS